MIKYYIPIIILPFLNISCRHNESSINTTELCKTYSNIEILDIIPTDTVFSFVDEYPVNIETTGDSIFLIFAMQDTTIKVIDTETKTIVKSLGIKGNGPEDILSPVFLYNRYITPENDLTLTDPNIRKIIKISLHDLTLKKEDMPTYLHNKSSINFFNNTIVAYPIIPDNYMFSIISLDEKQSEHRVTFPFNVNEDNKNKISAMPTYFATNINANIEKQRIIISMYYFDAYYVYDFDGNIISKFNLSDCEFNINTCIKKYFNLDKRGNIRYTRGYCTDKYCYLRRLEEIPDTDMGRYITTATKIIKTDWNGNPLAILNVPDGFKAFCIDENEDILAIVNSQRNEKNEYFDIIRFKQPETAFY